MKKAASMWEKDRWENIRMGSMVYRNQMFKSCGHSGDWIAKEERV